MRFLIFGVVILALVGGSEASRSQLKDKIGLITSIEVGAVKARTGDETALETEPCQRARLTEAQARQFFAKASIISPETRHHEYQWFPCWQVGSLVSEKGTFRWEINPGGTATVFSLSDSQQVYIVACESGCEDIFPFGGREYE